MASSGDARRSARALVGGSLWCAGSGPGALEAVEDIERCGKQREVAAFLAHWETELNKYERVAYEPWVTSCVLVKPHTVETWGRVSDWDGTGGYYVGCEALDYTNDSQRYYIDSGWNGDMSTIHRRIANGWTIAQLRELILVAREVMEGLR